MITALAGGSRSERNPINIAFRRKRNKFHVAPKSDRTWNGIQFDSKGEMERHQQLLLNQSLGLIGNLERQVPLVLVRGSTGKALLKWIVDWTYVEKDTGQFVAEDFTGVMTPLKRSNIRICADVYPHLLIRISHDEGTGKSKRTVVTDCVKGKLPTKRRNTSR